MGSKVKWVRLGEYISPRNERNSDLRYGVELIEGVNSDGEFQPTKAITDGIDLKPYKAVWPGDIVYNPSRLNIGSLAYRECGMCIVSHLYQVFYVKDKYKEALLPEYLLIWFKREEFSRIVDYYNYGSQRAEFNLKKLGELIIPLPSPEEQQKVVNAWKACREIKEQNEAKAAPLMQLCQSYIQELKHKYPAHAIGPYIEECNERNTEGLYGEEFVRGLATSKGMIDTKANLKGVSLNSYKLVQSEEIAYVPDTSRRGDKVSLGLNDTDKTYLVSSISCVFKSKDKKTLLPDYLYLWFCRPEFDRYARFNSWGSAREAFSFEDMKRTEIPLPPIDVQRAIVNIYKCANEAKQIAAEADRLSHEVCPALLQHIINS